MTTGAYGQVVQTDGTPAADAWVYAYSQAALRGPAEFAIRSEVDGRYVLDLLPGTWYLVARSRDPAGVAAPPRPGDRWAQPTENPFVLAEGVVRRIDFRLQPVSQTLLLRGGASADGEAFISGRLIDAAGQSVAGAYVLAYRDLDFQRMPDYSSPAVGADGRFTLVLPQAGRYCLAARQRSRGQPVRGELYGTLGRGSAACRDVKAGEVLDVGELRLTPFLR